MTMRGAKDLVAQANREVETLSVEEALARLGQPDTMLVDSARRGVGQDR